MAMIVAKEDLYKEAQAAPPPSPVGFIRIVWGSRARDYLSAIVSSPPPLFLGCGIFFMKILFLLIVSKNIYKYTVMG